MKTLFTRLMFVSFFMFIVSDAHALNIWNGGGGDASWNTAGNWDVAPIFDGTEDISMQTFTSGLITTLDGDKSINSLTIAATLGVGEIGQIQSGAPGTSKLILTTGNLTRNGGTTSREFIVASELELGSNGSWQLLTAGTTTRISGVISDGGSGFGISTSGTRTMFLDGDNTFDGDLTINSPVSITGDNSARSGQNIFDGSALRMFHDDALGSGKLVFNGGSLEVYTAANVSLSNPWEINGLMSYGGSRVPTLTGTLDPLLQDAFIQASTGGGSPRQVIIESNVTEGIGGINLTVNAGGNGTQPRFNGDIIISGDITMRGTGGQPGTLRLAGDNSGTSGDLIIDGTISSTGVTLLSETALTSGTFVINGSANKIQLSDDGSATVKTLPGALEWGGLMDLDQKNLEFTGNMVLSDSLSMQTGPANGILKLSGNISDGGNGYGIEMDPDNTRTGRLILAGTNTFSGNLKAEGGTTSGNAFIELDGASLSSSDITIGVRGNLIGTGTIIFSDDDTIDVDGIMTATSMLFDLTALSGNNVTLVDYSGGTFNGPGTLDDLLTASSVADGWFLTDTGTQILAEFPVPEPSSISLLALGLGIMTLRRRRQSKR